MAKARDLTQGNPMRLIVGFAIPLVIGSIFQQLYNIADTIIVGRFVGENALAAVGSAGSLTGLLIMLIMGATSGMSVVVSQYYGLGDIQTMKKTVVNSLYLIVLAAIIVTVVGLLFTRPLFKLINVPAEALEYAVEYMTIIFFGIIATAIYNMMSALLRALGDSVTPLIILILSSVLNIGLNLLFVLKFNMKVAGVAYSTIIATAISAIVCVVYAWIKIPILRFGKEHMKPDPKIIKMIGKIGMPSMLLSSTVSLGMLIIQAIINKYGATVSAAYTAALKIETLFTFPSSGIAGAMQVYSAQNAGIGRYDRIKEGFKAGVKLILSYDVIAIIALFLLGKPLLDLFTEEGGEVVKIGYNYTCMIALGLPFVGILLLSRNTMLGAGDAMVPFFMGALELLGRFLCSFLLAIPFGYLGVFMGTPVAWVLACAFGLWRYKQGKWMTKALTKNARAEQKLEEA